MHLQQRLTVIWTACTQTHDWFCFCALSQVRALFSASLSETVEELARTIMHNPVRVTVGEVLRWTYPQHLPADWKHC
jgi:superfamily II DNA/RNA helicase